MNTEINAVPYCKTIMETVLHSDFAEYLNQCIAISDTHRLLLSRLVADWQKLTDQFDAMAPGPDRDALAANHEATRLQIEKASIEGLPLKRRALALNRCLLWPYPGQDNTH